MAIAGCYRPEAADCSYRCGANEACPDNLTCELGYCREPGMTTACTAVTDDTMPGMATYSFLWPDGVTEPMNLGGSLAMSADGNRVVAGATSAMRNGMDLAGTAYVFERAGATWNVLAELRPDIEQNAQLFGSAVAITADGDTVAVGALGEGSSGALYIYDLSLSRRTKLTVPADFIGNAVALSDDGLGYVVGASSDASNSGAVAFGKRTVRTTDTWTSVVVRPANVISGGRFGSAVDINADATFAVVGEVGFSPHRARTFTSVPGNATWTESTALPAGGTVMDYGASVALADATVVIGAAANVGSAYVFTGADPTWTASNPFRGLMTDTDDLFGTSVDITPDGSVLVVGASKEDGGASLINGTVDNSVDNAGAAYVFRKNGADWPQALYIKAPTPAMDEGFGTAVAISSNGKTIAVSALHDSEVVANGGGVYVIDLP